MEKTPLYPYPAAYAKENGELEQYRASLRANIACKEAIQNAVRDHFDGMHLEKDAAAIPVAAFGLERVQYVLANTLQQKDWDGRFSPSNKAWAKSILIHEDGSAFGNDVRSNFVVETHPAILDGLVTLMRREYDLEKTMPQARPSVRKQLAAMKSGSDAFDALLSGQPVKDRQGER